MRRMNELGWDDTFQGAFAGSDTTKVERQVEALFRDAWRAAVNLLPRNYFSSKSFKNSNLISDVSTGSGFVVIPNNFYVLLLFKMKGWKKPCFTAIEDNDAISAVQSNDFVRGNFCRPACTISENLKYGRILNYYSLPKGNKHVIEEALYIPLIDNIVNLNDNTDLNLDERLYEPLQWINAGLVFSVFEKADIAKVANEKALEIIV